MGPLAAEKLGEEMNSGGESPESSSSSEIGSKALVPQGLGEQRKPNQSFPQLQEFIDIEKARVERDNKRTDVMRLAIEVSDASDKRQFDFHMANLAAEKEESQRRDLLREAKHQIGKKIIIFMIAFGVLMSSFFVYMLFFGSEEQRSTSIGALTILAACGAGYGIINPLVNWIKKFVNF